MSTVISLCDLTGNFTQPWSDNGYDVVLVDPQHGTSTSRFRSLFNTGVEVMKLAMTVEQAMPTLSSIIRSEDIAFVAGFPPCTNLACSGAKHFQRKMTDKSWEKYAGPNMFLDACRVAWQCEMVGQLSGAPWFVENPKSRLSTLWRKPDHRFDPFWFTALEPGDNYTKETYLWTGGGFTMPKRAQDPTLGPPDDRIHKAPPSAERANFRSATPMGFARAVFEANREPQPVELDLFGGVA